MSEAFDYFVSNPVSDSRLNNLFRNIQERHTDIIRNKHFENDK